MVDSHNPALAGDFTSVTTTFGGVNGATESLLHSLIISGTLPLMLIQFITPQENQIIPGKCTNIITKNHLMFSDFLLI